MQRTPFHLKTAEDRDQAPARFSRAKLFLGLAVVCALGVAVFLHLRSDAYSLARVAVSGNAVVSDDEIRALVPMGENLLWLDTGELAARLARHPFLAEVHLEKEYPDKLLVRVRERTPVLWLGEGRLTLLACDGTALPYGGGFDLPVLSGYATERIEELGRYGDVPILAACSLAAEMQRQALPLFGELVELCPHTDYLEGLLADGCRIIFPLKSTPTTLTALQAVYTSERGQGELELDARYERQIISRRPTHLPGA